MNRVTNPIGFRTNYNVSYASKWVAFSTYSDFFVIEQEVRKFIEDRLSTLGFCCIATNILFKNGRFFFNISVVELSSDSDFFEDDEDEEGFGNQKKKLVPRDFTYRPKKKRKRKSLKTGVSDTRITEAGIPSKAKVVYYKYLSKELCLELSGIFRPYTFTVTLNNVQLQEKVSRSFYVRTLPYFEDIYARRLDSGTYFSKGFIRTEHRKSMILAIFLDSPFLIARAFARAVFLDGRHSPIIKATILLLGVFILANPRLSGIKIKLKGRYSKSRKARKLTLKIGNSFSGSSLDDYVLEASHAVTLDNGVFNVVVSFYYSPTEPNTFIRVQGS